MIRSVSDAEEEGASSVTSAIKAFIYFNLYVWKRTVRAKTFLKKKKKKKEKNRREKVPPKSVGFNFVISRRPSNIFFPGHIREREVSELHFFFHDSDYFPKFNGQAWRRN